MILYSEGNNFKYLNKAKSFFNPDLPIKFYDGGGKSELETLFKMFIRNRHDEKTIILFDSDAEKEYKRCKTIESEQVKALILPKNEKNNKYNVGIENMFSNGLILKSKAYSVTLRYDKKFGRPSRIPNFDTFKFCDFICNQRNRKADFKNFEDIFGEIESFINE